MSSSSRISARVVSAAILLDSAANHTCMLLRSTAVSTAPRMPFADDQVLFQVPAGRLLVQQRRPRAKVRVPRNQHRFGLPGCCWHAPPEAACGSRSRSLRDRPPASPSRGLLRALARLQLRFEVLLVRLTAVGRTGPHPHRLIAIPESPSATSVSIFTRSSALNCRYRLAMLALYFTLIRSESSNWAVASAVDPASRKNVDSIAQLPAYSLGVGQIESGAPCVASVLVVGTGLAVVDRHGHSSSSHDPRFEPGVCRCVCSGC